MLGLAVMRLPQKDEGLLGFLYRLAEQNALTGAELLRSFRSASERDVVSWVTGPGKPQTWLSECTELRQPGSRSARVWCHRGRKYCPHCLEEERYWRSSWSLMLVTCCTRHQVPLVDCCISCGSQLVAESMRHLRCAACGESLVRATRDQGGVSPAEVWLTRKLTQCLARPRKPCARAAVELTLSELHELALRLGIRGINHSSSKPLKLRDAGALRSARPIADSAGRAMMGWPNNFFRLLDSIRDQRGRSADWKISRVVGPIYRDIYRHLGGAQFEFVRLAFEAYVSERWEAPLTLRNRNFQTKLIDEHHWVALSDAANKIGVDPALLRRMVKHGDVAAREHTHASGRTSRVVNLAPLWRDADRLRHASTLQQVAVQMGLGERRVRQLLEANILAPIGGRPRSGERWWVDSTSIEGRVRPACRTSIEPSHSVSVAHVAKFNLLGADEFVTLIRAIQSGGLTVFVPPDAGNQMGRWLLSEVEIKAWRAALIASPSTLSVNEAALRLGVKQEVAYALVRAGVLPATSVTIGRRLAQRIAPASIRDFSRRYVFGTELATKLNISPKQVAIMLRCSGIRPISGPGVVSAPCRQYVWRRTRKLEALIRGVSQGRQMRQLASRESQSPLAA